MPAPSSSTTLTTPSLDAAHQIILALIDTFEKNQAHYLTSTYSEAALRQDFLDRLFIALGWDVTHDTQTNPAEQEVKIERGVSVGAAQKRADYAFYLLPNYRDVRFYVEAKKPSVALDTNADAHFQTLRYGWNSNTPLAVLTDFEQFHILDCRAIPNIGNALKRTHKKFRYTDFKDKEKFAEVYWLFSREALASGAHDRYVAELPKPKAAGKQMGLLRTGIQRVDESFLAELEQHRETLAKSFKRDNPELDGFELTEVTQRVLDRLVFLRFLEDKLIETEISVNEIANSAAPWATFVKESRRLDARYNGVVYKPHPLIDAPSKFTADDADFKAVCDALSDKHSPFNFDVIPIHILGSIYERFLGKVITTTDKRAKVEEKPEVRKAGGVYYTPEYIVRYIVDQTVGAQIEGKTPEQIAKLRFADIACGSGSFLLGVFDVLLRYHTRWYNQHPDKAEKAGCAKTDEAAWRLSLKQRQSILLNNVFGVDVDQQAVEVSQVSLYLKLLEDETTSSSNQYSLLFKEALLPALGQNVVCGNSLIGTDILDGQMFPREEERALNAMDFEAAFPAVMRQGGFDAVVGNPPYIRIQTLNETNPRAVVYFKNRYHSAAKGNYDIYVIFAERGLELLNSQGKLGFILPNKFLRTDYGQDLRRLLTQKRAVEALVDFGHDQVFNVTTYTCLLFLSGNPSLAISYGLTQANAESLASVELKPFAWASLQENIWAFNNESVEELLKKLNSKSIKLIDLPTEISRGSSTGADDVFMLESSNVDIEPELLREPLFASDFGRYEFRPDGEFKIIFPYQVNVDGIDLLEESDLKKRFPKAHTYLLGRKTELLKRKQYRKWYGYSAPRNLELHEKAEICIPLLANRGLFSLIPENKHGMLCPMASGGFTISVIAESGYSAKYVLGLINSSLLFWHLTQMSNVFRGGWITCTKQYFADLAIRPINFTDPADKAVHDRLVQLVDDMLNAKRALAAARSERDTGYYTRRCDQLDQQIDTLVYALYGLTDEEIALVEGRKDELT